MDEFIKDAIKDPGEFFMLLGAAVTGVIVLAIAWRASRRASPNQVNPNRLSSDMHTSRFSPSDRGKILS